MRNHDTTSASMSTAPNATPTKKYGTSAIIASQLLEQRRQEQIRRRQTAGKEAAHGHERRELTIGQARDRVTGRAPAGVRGAEADEKAAHHDRGESPERDERRPREDLARRQAGEVVHTDGPEIGHRPCRQVRTARWGEPGGERRARKDPEKKRQIPEPVALPVMAKELDPARRNRGAHVTEISGHTECLVADQQQRGNGQPDERSSDVPRQWMRHTILISCRSCKRPR